MPSSLEHFCVDFLWLPTMPSPTDARCDDSKSCQVEVTGATIDWSVESGRIPYLLTHCPPLQPVPIKWEGLLSFFFFTSKSRWDNKGKELLHKDSLGSFKGSPHRNRTGSSPSVSVSNLLMRMPPAPIPLPCVFHRGQAEHLLQEIVLEKERASGGCS